jgi:toxin CcdB
LVVRQYDICRNLNMASRKEAPFLIVLQADLLEDLRTVVIAPVRVETLATKISKLIPAAIVKGKPYRFSMPELTGILRKYLGEVVANVVNQHYEFVAAIDLIFTGI